MRERGADSTGWAVALAFRYGLNCWLCGQGLDPDDPFEVEHVKPKSAGGKRQAANLRLAHASCNGMKWKSAVNL